MNAFSYLFIIGLFFMLIDLSWTQSRDSQYTESRVTSYCTMDPTALLSFSVTFKDRVVSFMKSVTWEG